MLALRRGALAEERASGFDVAAWQGVIARVRAADIEPVLLLPPCVARQVRGRAELAALVAEVCVLELDRPDDLRELFTFAMWYDAAHVTRAGASLLSRACAERFVHRRVGARLPPAIVPPPAELVVAWTVEGDALAIAVQGLDEPGEVLALVSMAPADADLGHGMRGLVALPSIAQAPLPRTGASAQGRCPMPTHLRGPFYVQAAVWRHGVLVEVTQRASASHR